jgi:hypothetical protein
MTTKEEVLFSLGGECPGGIPFKLEEVWDISRDAFWGTVLLEVYSPDERHARYWPQIAVRLVWQEMFRVPSTQRKGFKGRTPPIIHARIPRAEIHQDGYVDFSEEAVWLSQLDVRKLVAAMAELEVMLTARRAEWNPTNAEVAAFAEQDKALASVCAQFKQLSRPDEIRSIAAAPAATAAGAPSEDGDSLRLENERLRAELAALQQRHDELVDAALRLRRR